jgi:hypothetical protein
MSAQLFKIIIILGAILILIFGSIFMIYFREHPNGETSKQGDILKPAHYKHGHNTIVKSFDVNINGGVFEIGSIGTPIDGTVVEIPERALDKEVTLSVGHNDGVLNLRSGKGSGIVIVLSTKTVIDFEKPVKIKVRFDPSLNPKTVVGYSIDEQGRLHVIDIGAIKKEIGEVSFYTFYTPFMFTWVYIY